MNDNPNDPNAQQQVPVSGGDQTGNMPVGDSTTPMPADPMMPPATPEPTAEVPATPEPTMPAPPVEGPSDPVVPQSPVVEEGEETPGGVPPVA